MSDPILGPNGWECDNTTTAIPRAVFDASTGGIEIIGADAPMLTTAHLRLKNTGIRIMDGRIAATHAVDGTSGTTYSAVFTLAEVPDAVWPIYANGGASPITINAVSACAVSESDLNGNSATIAVGDVSTNNVVPVSPGTTQPGLIIGNRILIDNPAGSKMVQVRAHVAAGAGTITTMGNGAGGTDSYTNWATRTGMVHAFRAQTGNQTATAGAFTSTTNVSYCPIIGVKYIARGRVVTVMVTGDSIDSGRGTYRFDAPVWQALRSKTRSGYAVEFANLAWAGSGTANNRNTTGIAFAAGIVPDILLRPIASPNDITSSIADSVVTTWRQTAAITSDACQQYGVTFVPRTMCPANSSIDTPTGAENWGADDVKRRAMNDEMRLWRARGIRVADFDAAIRASAANANGQVPIADGFTTDAIHPSDAGNAAIAALMLTHAVLP